MKLTVPPGQKLVSYDVSALFTSIPINEAMPIVRSKLVSDPTLPDRCSLDVSQLSTLLEMCLSSTYFTFQNELYKQKQGAAMGSSISPIVANLYMEHFESRALDTAPTRPSMWYRYVDDTMTKIHECAVSSFSDHFNSINPNIQFTSQEEKNGRIPFLDTCLHVNEHSSTKVTVYRKPTHTDQYLNFHSNHHQSSAVHEHCKLTGHSVESSKTKVLATESNTFKRRIRDAIEIRLRNPSFNRDNGFELARIYDTILAPLRSVYNLSWHQIWFVADEVRVSRTKYSIRCEFLNCALSTEIVIFKV